MRVLTANRLIDGEVVFWRAGEWVERFDDAECFAGEDQDAETALMAGKARRTEVIDPYLIDVIENQGGPAPLSYRERLRALGPTNEPHHGKQAEGGNAIERLRLAAGASRSTGRIDLIRRK